MDSGRNSAVASPYVIMTRQSPFFRRISERPVWLWVFYVLFSVIMRGFSFFPSVINHDESTYLVIANEILHGRQYWIDIFDTKPVGIFLLYAGLIKVFGHSILAIRFFTALWVASTAFLLHRLQWRWGNDLRGGWISGIGYIFLTSVFKFYGVSPNTELYFSGLFVLALVLLWRNPWRLPEAIGTGILLGCALVIKQSVIFDILPLAILLMVRLVQQPQERGKRLLWLTVWAVSALIPFSLILLWYAQAGHLDSFLYYTFEMAGNYIKSPDGWVTAGFIASFFGRYFPITILAILALSQPSSQTRLMVLYCLGMAWRRLGRDLDAWQSFWSLYHPDDARSGSTCRSGCTSQCIPSTLCSPHPAAPGRLDTRLAVCFHKPLFPEEGLLGQT